jgi:WS/DGAT/MGAT family acyltransferase
MARLGGIDASFLYLETPETPMHVAGLTLYEKPKDLQGSFYEHFKTFFRGRLHLIPIFGMKLSIQPLNLDHPAWVEEEDLDIDYHIRSEVLPAPGSQAQLEALVARLHSQLMDRTRPLWQFTVIEGLADGRAALYSKVHHAAVDGGAGMIITRALYDLTPVPRAVEPPKPKAPPKPRDAGTDLAELFGSIVKQQQQALRAMPEVFSAMAKLFAPPADRNAPISELFPNLKFANLQLVAPKTVFNASVTSHRSYAARSLSLTDAKIIAKATGVKINDVVMAVCGGALRRYLARRKALPEASLLAFVPISLREAGNTDINNQVSGMICPIGSNEADPLKRLAAVRAASTDAKEIAGSVKSAMPQDYTFLGAPIIINALMSLYGRFKAADWLPSPANVTISNTQGPNVSLYCAGARVAALYPVSIPAHGVALNITVQSYCDQLDFGLTADKQACPDIDALAEDFAVAMAELKDAATASAGASAPAEAPGASEKPARKAKSTPPPA